MRASPLLLPALVCAGLIACHAPRVGVALVDDDDDAARCDEGVEDPYRHLEDLSAPEVQAWMRERSELARTQLEAIPGLDALARDHAALDARAGSAQSMLRMLPDGGALYLDGAAGGARLMHRPRGGDASVLLDPSELRARAGAEQDYVISYFNPSWSGDRVVVALTKDGEELAELIILETESGARLPTTLSHCWPSDSGGVHWLPDDSGFVYLHHPVTDPRSPGFLHDMEAVLYRLGSAPEARELLLSAAHDPQLGIEAHDFPMVFIPRRDSAYAVALIGGASPYAASFVTPIEALAAGAPRWRPLFRAQDKVTDFAIVGDHVDLLSARRRPEYELLRVPLATPSLDQAERLAAPPEGETIAAFASRGDELVFVSWRDGVAASLTHRDAQGELSPVELPAAFGELGLAAELVPGRSLGPGESLALEGGGWLSPRRRYRYDFDARELVPEGASFEALEGGLEGGGGLEGLEQLLVEERVALAADGVELPVSLIYRRDTPRDGARPTLIYGYGAYGMSATPFFYPPFLLWALRGGVVAVAHVRGGGEKGEAWHEGGRKQTKPNTWGDAIACAEALQSEDWGFTSPAHTAIWGVSAGGVMVGRAITQRPELFAAAIAEVAMLNPARIEHSANGDNSSKEFGRMDDPLECAALLEMDAYLHVREGVDYPAVLVRAGLNDPRVDPWESSKFAARLERANASASAGGPTLLWLEEQAGHGMDETPASRRARVARLLGFGLQHTGHPDFAPPR